jgi:putative ABC transport system permease protein
MSALWQDTRYGLRTLRKQPGFTAVAIIALALGIGANTTMFSVINALLLHPFSFPEGDRLAAVWESRVEAGQDRDGFAPANFLDVRAETKAFSAAAAFSGWSANLTEGDQPERLEGAAVSPQFFDVLGVRPALGRAFLAEEEQPGRDPVVIIGDGLWRRRFNADRNIVGRNVRINERSFNVVGVMPPDFDFPQGGKQVWTPLLIDADDASARGAHYLQVIARLKPGATDEQARDELAALARRLSEQYPDTNANRGFFTQNLTENYVRGPRPYLLIMLGAVLFVLLVACANVANLQLMRAAARQKEIAVRLALGASRWRVVRQLLTESVLLALAGGLAGLLLSVWAVDAIAASLPANFARYVSGWRNLGIDWRVFAFTLGVSVLTGVVFGLTPALLATRTNLNESLKEGGRTGDSGGRGRARAALVVAEVALSLVLLAGAGLMVRSFLRMLDVRPGFDARDVLTMELSLPSRKYKEPAQVAQFYEQLTARVAALPGVTGAGLTNVAPLSMNDDSTHFSIAGQPPPPPGAAPLADFRTVNPGLFGALGVPVTRGRNFDARDTRAAPHVVLVSERLARRFFPNEDPLGRRIQLGDDACEIVGIVGDVRYKSFVSEAREERLRGAIYVPHAQVPYREVTLVVRSATDASALTAAVRQEVQALDKDQPVYNVRTMPQVFAEAVAPQRLSAYMFAGFALIALVLAAVGLYAVIAYSVALRTHEIGVRMALGAQPRDVFRLIIGQGLRLILVGVALGVAGALAVTRTMASVLYGVSATDATTYAAISLLLALVALVACYVPARRATKVDPMVALRYE